MSQYLNFANINSLWGSFLAESLYRAGVRHAVVCPGSRSAPLACALAEHRGISAVPVLDERSGAFFALGLAKRTGFPAVLVCTSGTAAANFYPAVIEARESGVPLLILTADRPPEMRECASGQTIDQVKIFGNYPRWQAEMAVPEPTLKMLQYLRQTLRHACERTLFPAGPVHLNLPFRDPLAPVPDGSLRDLDREAVAELLRDFMPVPRRRMECAEGDIREAAREIGEAKRVLVVAGPAEPEKDSAEAIVDFGERIGVPVLADLLSQAREIPGARGRVVDCYERLFARGNVPEEPDLVVRFGPLPTSKRLRQWLETVDCRQIVVEAGDRNVDPLHGRSWHFRADAKAAAAALTEAVGEREEGNWRRDWLDRNAAARAELERGLRAEEELVEGKVPWILAEQAPEGAAVFVSSSTPVRDAEFFWVANGRERKIYFNRGANGIDGIVSTAMGIASEGGQTFLVTGDLALLHDQNGLLNWRALRGGLTVILVNNGGGGIFQSLPVAKFDPPFREFFMTPQAVDFRRICEAHEIGFTAVDNWGRFAGLVGKPWTSGVRVIELRTDAVRSLEARARLLSGELRG